MSSTAPTPDALTDAIAILESHIENAREGLPFAVFELISRLTPMVNVDLLIKDSHDRFLLAWRDDQFAGQGWHIPGGIIRFKETLHQRIQQVALREIGKSVEFDPEPIAMNQVHCSHDTRGHFISLLYSCRIDDDYELDNHGRLPSDPGFLAWHEQCPDNLVKVHEMYRTFLS